MSTNYIDFSLLKGRRCPSETSEYVTIVECTKSDNKIIYCNIKGISGIVVGTLKNCYLGVPENHPWNYKNREFFNTSESPISVCGGVTYTDIEVTLNGVVTRPEAVELIMSLNHNKYKYWIGWEYNNLVEVIDIYDSTPTFELVRDEALQVGKIADDLIHACRIAKKF